MILTVDQLRQHITSGLGDDVLQRMLTDAEVDIISALGEAGAVTEYIEGGHELLVLQRQAGTITTVTEYADTDSESELADDDYRVEGFMLRRLNTGTNPSYTWLGRVKVEHTPTDDHATRIRLQVALVKLDLAFSGYAAEATQDESRSPIGDYQLARTRILRSATREAVMVA